jgi:hypothetical protein
MTLSSFSNYMFHFNGFTGFLHIVYTLGMEEARGDEE